MATPVSTTIARTSIDSTTTRWHARASTISETVQQLGRIWSSAADEAERALLDERDRERAMGDPRLGGRLDRHGDTRVRTRTSVLTLVVVAPRPETTERALAIVSALASRHPSRSVVISPGDPDGLTTFDAHIYAACHLATASGAEVCTEEILVHTGGELSQHLATVVAPLLIHDLPVVLWWPDDPPFESRAFRDLAEACDGVLVDSGTFRDDGTRGLRGMQETVDAGHSMHDIGWMRLSLWRELLAGLFDHPLLTTELPGCRHLRLDVARPGSVVRISKAACFAGWLGTTLGWTVETPLRRAGDGETLAGVFRNGRRLIPLEIRPVGGGIGAAYPSAGSLVRVELELVRGRAVTRSRVTRQADHLLATADWNGAQVSRRAGRLELFEETPFLAEALDRTAHDPVFERALKMAVELTDG